MDDLTATSLATLMITGQGTLQSIAEASADQQVGGPENIVSLHWLHVHPERTLYLRRELRTAKIREPATAEV